MATLNELTSVLRSKNAGALLCTLDLMFEDQTTYERARQRRDHAKSDRRAVPRIHNEVSIIPYDVAYAIKITVPAGAVRKLRGHRYLRCATTRSTAGYRDSPTRNYGEDRVR